MTREFEVLRTKYWPGRLLDWRVEHRSFAEDFVGYCDYAGRRRRLDLNKPAHRSARQRRITLLHECCHAVRGRGGHDEGFFSEIERLHRMGENALDLRDAERYGAKVLQPFPHCWKRWECAFKRHLRRRVGDYEPPYAELAELWAEDEGDSVRGAHEGRPLTA